MNCARPCITRRSWPIWRNSRRPPTSSAPSPTLPLRHPQPMPLRRAPRPSNRRPAHRPPMTRPHAHRSEEHTSELQSRPHLVCRLLLEQNKTILQELSPLFTVKVALRDIEIKTVYVGVIGKATTQCRKTDGAHVVAIAGAASVIRISGI